MKLPSSRILKANARKLLQGNYKFFALTTLTVTALNFLTTNLLGSIFTSGGMWNLILQFGCTAILDIFYYLLSAGVIRTYMKLSCGHPFSMQDLLFAFSNRPEQIAVFAVIQFVLETAMANLVFSYPLDLLTGAASGFQPTSLLTAVIVLLIFTWLQLRLAPVLYLYNTDPECSMLHLIKESWQLMNGKCLRLFWLEFTFLGIEFLCLLSLGIGYLFAQPYQRTAVTLFIHELCDGFFPEPEDASTEEDSFKDYL